MNRKFIKDLTNNINKDDIGQVSAQCSYYTILSFIPFVILVITLIQYTGIEPSTLFEFISKIIPDSMNEIVVNIVQEVYSKSIGTISISIIFTIWSAGKGLFALTKGMQNIYKTRGEENASYLYIRIKAILETILFIILIVIGLVMLVFGNNIRSILDSRFQMSERYNILSTIGTELAFTVATFIIFLLLYKFMPKHKEKLKSQIRGALFSAIALNIVSFVFSKYLYIFKGFSITYGSLTTLMLIMMWTYLCFYIIFIGAELNKTIKMEKEKCI